MEKMESKLQLREQLFKLIEEYERMLTSITATHYVPILKNEFTEFVLQFYTCCDVKQLFKEEITKNGIIQSAVFYLQQNENRRSISRLKYYLNVVDKFFEQVIFPQYQNPNIRDIFPFTSLFNAILDELKGKDIVLREEEKNPPIDDEQYYFILEMLNNNKKTIKHQQVSVIVKLYLLLGLSPDKVRNLRVRDFEKEKNVLNIRCSIKKDVVIKKELPYRLSEEIKNFLEKRGANLDDYLFVTRNLTKINETFLKDFLDDAKEKYESVDVIDKNPFTPTGLQKYAIIKMIEAGMNQSVIMDFTGQKNEIFEDCQEWVNEKRKLNRNRYINQMIRGIDTFDEV